MNWVDERERPMRDDKLNWCVSKIREKRLGRGHIFEWGFPIRKKIDKGWHSLVDSDRQID